MPNNPHPASPEHRASVLVVDDEPEIREVLQEHLSRLGYDVRLAETAVGALGAVRTQRPDVVLLDLQMPGAVSGDSVITTIAAETPVVIITAVADVERARPTLQLGAFDFVMKPFDLDHVAEVVEAAIAFGRGRSNS